MDKGERISQFVSRLAGEGASVSAETPIEKHPYYRAFFVCWNEQRYYEAHDVLEQVWLNKESADDDFFKGLIQAAGAFVHLQKNFNDPEHPKHAGRLRPAVRLFDLAEKNLTPFAPSHHALDLNALLELMRATRARIVDSDYKVNPWGPETAPKLELKSE